MHISSENLQESLGSLLLDLVQEDSSSRKQESQQSRQLNEEQYGHEKKQH
jgi:hypothetical protein